MEPFALLAGTFELRPYVFGFLTAWIFGSAVEIGLRRSAVWLVLGYAVALACEASSTSNGFPFGLYHYFSEPTRDRELWVAGVPFMDSLSFVFLSFTSWATARRVLGRGPDPAGRIEARRDEIVLGAALMVAIDLVCDPVSLQGDRWFLGRIYDYAERGAFFGVPLSTFLGWAFVALAVLAAMAGLERAGLLAGRPRLRGAPAVALWAPALWAAIVLFNVAIAFWIDLVPVKTLDSFRHLEKLLLGKEFVVIFPEGTYYPRSMGGGKHRLIEGILRFQEKMKWEGEQTLPFIPMGIHYLEKKVRSEVRVKIGLPLYARGKTEAQEFTRVIVEEIARLSGLNYSRSWLLVPGFLLGASGNRDE